VKLTDQDSRVLEIFHLNGGRNPNQIRRSPQLQVGERNWKPPSSGSLKLNFNGVAKGNPGRTGLGGVIRDNKGNIIWLYDGSLGNSTNNVVEFGSLETGLEILSWEGMTNSIVEGDFALVINIVIKIQNGTRMGKIQRHWRLAHLRQKIQEHLRTGIRK
jgi:ribonuclease HI